MAVLVCCGRHADGPTTLFTADIMTARIRRGAAATRAAGSRRQVSTELFERYQRSEKALFRRVVAITEELCGHGFSASSISEITTAVLIAIGIHRDGRRCILGRGDRGS
jgi:hypothetical protein